MFLEGTVKVAQQKSHTFDAFYGGLYVTLNLQLLLLSW